MKLFEAIILFLFCYVEYGYASEVEKKYPVFPAPQHETVSMISLISNSSAYDGKKVRVSGYLNFTGEYNTIYYNKEASKLGNGSDGVAVEFGESKYSGLSWTKVKAKFDNSYGYILGTFHSCHSINAGLITDIEDISIVLIEDR